MCSRSWLLSTDAQRAEIEDVLADNPGLKPRIDEALARGYRKARIDAAKETGLDQDEFPTACPYSFDEVGGAQIRALAERKGRSVESAVRIELEDRPQLSGFAGSSHPVFLCGRLLQCVRAT